MTHLGKIGRNIFHYQDQVHFSCLSGDTNPIHMDAVTARRSVVGDIVVHGMHTVLWALERLSETNLFPANLAKLEVLFPKPLYLGEEVELCIVDWKDNNLRLLAHVGEKNVAKIRLWWAELASDNGETVDEVIVPDGEPRNLSAADLIDDEGTITYAVRANQFAEAFPTAASCFGINLLRDLAACSRLVGMQCPGLRSLFSRLSLQWETRSAGGRGLHYAVASVDDHFGLVNITISGKGISGRVEAFCLSLAPAQMTMNEVAERVAKDKFAGQTALIIGGSRGLGELTAKMIAAGGGRVVVSYVVGQGDAVKVVEEIRQFGGDIHIIRYDAFQPAADQLAFIADLGTPTNVYYYATRQIFRSKAQTFDRCLLDGFIDIYVHGFLALCQGLWGGGIRNLSCFYPSSTAVESRPIGLTEYAMAKAAGEVLTADLEDLFPSYRGYFMRLPRLLTDQTALVTPQNLPLAIDVLLPMLDRIQKDARNSCSTTRL